jgi:hypothetical protein
MNRVLINVLSAVCFFAAGCTISGNLKNPPGANLLLAQESPTSSQLDVYINGIKYISTLSYTSYKGYTLLPPGTYTMQVALAGSDTVLIPSAMLTLQTGLNYSFFLVDSINAVQGVLIPDNLNAPVGNTAKIRFMQFSPLGDSVSVDSVYFAIKDTGILSGYRYFNDQNNNPALDSFVTIPAGPHNFEVSLDSTLTNIVLNQTDTLLAGKIYTFILRGLQNYAGTPYGLQAYLLKHN